MISGDLLPDIMIQNIFSSIVGTIVSTGTKHFLLTYQTEEELNLKILRIIKIRFVSICSIISIFTNQYVPRWRQKIEIISNESGNIIQSIERLQYRAKTICCSTGI
ncbi:MAG: hypothetical protein H0X03_06610 [Nitrosopumilus sp.]|jgi:hypothetical protein|nr:hypothetical protein [Nitrosopumilus sp.]